MLSYRSIGAKEFKRFFSKLVLVITQNFEFVKVSKNAIVYNPL